MRKPSPLETRIAQLKTIHQLLQPLRTQLSLYSGEDRGFIAAELRDIADELEASSRNEPANDATPEVGPSRAVEQPTTVQRMRRYFETTGNKPATAAAIAEAVGAEYETVRSVLYKRNKGRFVRAGEDGPSSLWVAVLDPVGRTFMGEELDDPEGGDDVRNN